MKNKKSEEGITVKKEDNFSEWFTQVITKSKAADYSPVSGAIVYRPLSYGIWEKIKEECDREFKKIGVENSYFPLFIPESLLKKEQEHVEGFAPEVAWVDYGGNTKLGERLAIRPTSEAIMYYSYSKWIKSYNDLPLLLNQWNNVVRWEFKHPILFFRGREFLWNEMHTAFATEKEALEHGKKVIRAYNKVTEQLMALPGIYGRKTETEKFAGGIFSEKMHHFLPNGRVIEGVCFHYDGQNFARAYNIKFKTKDEKDSYVFQNTHAISTRMLGAMFAVHSDNSGLVIPPRLAKNKVVIIPIIFENTKDKILKEAEKLKKILVKFNPVLDSRTDISPGRKYNEWELRGIPLRIELGPKDLEKKQAVVVKRNDGKKEHIKITLLKKEIPKILEKIQKELYENAEKLLVNSIRKTDSKKELIKFIRERKTVIVPMCKSAKCEEKIKEETGGAKVLFIDSENNAVKNKECIACNKSADYWVYIGKSY
jgi:prolyl-tRNA synthetase